MKLFYANTSPYARKARMTILEKGLMDRVEQVFQNPFEDSPALKSANPLGKVPALILNDDAAIFDSSVICAYLDTLTDDLSLYRGEHSGWKVRVGEALANGILDATFNIVMERRRPMEQQSKMWLDRWQGTIDRAMNAVEVDVAAFKEPLNAAQIALAAALGYLDFRMPDFKWRAERSELTAWFTVFSERPSMKLTDPGLS